MLDGRADGRWCELIRNLVYAQKAIVLTIRTAQQVTTICHNMYAIAYVCVCVFVSNCRRVIIHRLLLLGGVCVFALP